MLAGRELLRDQQADGDDHEKQKDLLGHSGNSLSVLHKCIPDRNGLQDPSPRGPGTLWCP